MIREKTQTRNCIVCDSEIKRKGIQGNKKRKLQSSRPTTSHTCSSRCARRYNLIWRKITAKITARHKKRVRIKINEWLESNSGIKTQPKIYNQIQELKQKIGK